MLALAVRTGLDSLRNIPSTGSHGFRSLVRRTPPRAVSQRSRAAVGDGMDRQLPPASLAVLRRRLRGQLSECRGLSPAAGQKPVASRLVLPKVRPRDSPLGQHPDAELAAA